MKKWLIFAFFTTLLIGAGYLFGINCRKIGESCQLILSPSTETLHLLLWLLLALGFVAFAAGLVAALLRPVWVGIIAFILSGPAILLGWQVSAVSVILVLVYLLAASLYIVGVARELKERIRFSVSPISDGQSMLLMALILVACGSLYLGCATHIEQEGFSIPEAYTEIFMEQMKNQMENQFEAQAPEEMRQEAMADFEEHFQGTIDDFFEHTVKPYEQYIPLAIAAGLYMPLTTISGLLTWIPALFLSVAFRLLTAMGITTVVSETQEVQKLVVS